MDLDSGLWVRRSGSEMLRPWLAGIRPHGVVIPVSFLGAGRCARLKMQTKLRAASGEDRDPACSISTVYGDRGDRERPLRRSSLIYTTSCSSSSVLQLMGSPSYALLHFGPPSRLMPKDNKKTTNTVRAPDSATGGCMSFSSYLAVRITLYVRDIELFLQTVKDTWHTECGISPGKHGMPVASNQYKAARVRWLCASAGDGDVSGSPRGHLTGSRPGMPPCRHVCDLMA